jgi:signal transduction histidine kinase
LHVVYEDDGQGIAAKDKGRLFERGFGKNTGYGLFFAREILEMTGIGISEVGEEGKGARFIITVPRDCWRPVR